MKTIHNIKRRRGAFTLLELLIVISIIALLMSLSVVVLLGVLNQAEEEATSATIQKVNRLLEQRIEAFDRSFKGARRTTAIQMMRSLLADPNSDGNSNDGIFGVTDAVVEILAKKALFRNEFPQRIADRTAFGVFSAPRLHPRAGALLQGFDDAIGHAGVNVGFGGGRGAGGVGPFAHGFLL